MIKWAMCLGVAAALWACGGGRAMQRCPESPRVPCMTRQECSVDRERGCEMCRCSAPGDVPLERDDALPPPPPE
jgi:hypothetical protein